MVYRFMLRGLIIEEHKINEYECTCGYVWIDDANYGCPMCQNHVNIIRRDYVIPQPENFAHKQGDNYGKSKIFES